MNQYFELLIDMTNRTIGGRGVYIWSISNTGQVYEYCDGNNPTNIPTAAQMHSLIEFLEGVQHLNFHEHLETVKSNCPGALYVPLSPDRTHPISGGVFLFDGEQPPELNATLALQLKDFSKLMIIEISAYFAARHSPAPVNSFRNTQILLGMALRTAGMGTWSWDTAADLVENDAVCMQLWGFEPEQFPLRSEHIFARVHPDDRDILHAAIDEARQYQDYTAAFRIVVDGNTRWIGNNGGFVEFEGKQYLVGIAYDITSQKTDEELELLQLRELHHRMRNHLTLTASLIKQSARHEVSVTEMADKLLGRIQAVDLANTSLLDGGWDHLAVRPLIQNVLGFIQERVQLSGDDIQIASRQSASLSLLLHELATNAVKHGSLSGSAGKVELSWTVREYNKHRVADFVWREIDGPELSQAPQIQGFGSQLIRRILNTMSETESAMHWHQQGLECCFTLPVYIP